jgi:hypothetical protein
MNKHLKNINVQMYIKPKLRTIWSSIIHVPVLFIQSNIGILHGIKRPARNVLLIATVVLHFVFIYICTFMFFKCLFVLLWYLF